MIQSAPEIEESVTQHKGKPGINGLDLTDIEVILQTTRIMWSAFHGPQLSIASPEEFILDEPIVNDGSLNLRHRTIKTPQIEHTTTVGVDLYGNHDGDGLQRGFRPH
jgi:hypothetical protein